MFPWFQSHEVSLRFFCPHFHPPSRLLWIFFFFFPKDFHSFRRQAFFFLLPLAVVEKPQRPLGPHGIVLSHAAPASRTRDGIRSDSRAGRAENTEHEEEKSRCWSTEEIIFRPVAWRINHCLQWCELSGWRSWSPVLVSSSHNCDWLIRFNSGSKKSCQSIRESHLETLPSEKVMIVIIQ